MKKTALVVVVHTLLFAPSHAQDSASSYSASAKAIQANVSLSETASNSAMQVSQIHDQARTKLLVILIQQNDEIIRLLQELKNKKLKDFLF